MDKTNAVYSKSRQMMTSPPSISPPPPPTDTMRPADSYDGDPSSSSSAIASSISIILSSAIAAVLHAGQAFMPHFSQTNSLQQHCGQPPCYTTTSTSTSGLIPGSLLLLLS